MKKKIIILSILFLFSARQTLAQNETPQIDSQINKLKERIASRVAELKLVERRGIIGIVESASSTQITLLDQSQNTRYVDVDELTKFNGNDSKNKNFGISDIKKGDTLGILGIFNKQSERLLARFVDEGSLETTIHGTISSLDSKNFTATFVTDSPNLKSLNFDTSTKIFSYTKGAGMVKSGFSKLQVGEFFVALGSADSNDKSLFDATRVIVLSEVMGSIPSPTFAQTPILHPTK